MMPERKNDVILSLIIFLFLRETKITLFIYLLIKRQGWGEEGGRRGGGKIQDFIVVELS